MSKREDAERYRELQAEALLRGMLVKGTDGKWHHAYVRQRDGSYEQSLEHRAARAAFKKPELRKPDLQDGKLLP